MTLRVAERILDLIGQTPLLRLGALEPPGGAAIWPRPEYLNPGSSVTNRAALGMGLDAEQRGLLRPDPVIIEPTIVPHGMTRHRSNGIVEVPTEAHA